MNTKKAFAGIWRFYISKISLGDLEHISRELATDSDYIHLFLRKLSRDKNGICFAKYYDGDFDQVRQYISKTTKFFEDRLGKETLAGHDISGEIIKIDGFDL